MGTLNLGRSWQLFGFAFRISIPILDNRAVDGSRSFTISLANVANVTNLNPFAVAMLVEPSTATVTILDDDNLAGAGYGIDDQVLCSVPQPDGKIVIGGLFNSVDGYRRNFIARLNSDLSCDAEFDPGTGGDGAVLAIALQSDGKVIAGGAFTNLNGQRVNYIARLLPDGRIDPGFHTGAGAQGLILSTAAGLFLSPVSALALRPDGKILVGGSYTKFNDVFRPGLTQLNPDGTVDTNFNPALVPYVFYGDAFFAVNALLPLPDGGLIVGGRLSPDDVPGQSLVKLRADGSLDPAFLLKGPPGKVYALALQDDGKILAAGDSWIVRRNPDGSIDDTFNRELTIGVTEMDSARTIALTADQKILVGGWQGCVYLTLSPETRACRGLLRLNSDGTLDESYQLGELDRSVLTISILKEDSAFLGGPVYPFRLTGSPGYTQRLHSDGTVIEDLHFLPVVRTANGATHLRLQGQSGRPYTLEASTDFRSWKPVLTNDLFLAEGLGFVDTNAVNAPQKFYRVFR